MKAFVRRKAGVSKHPVVFRERVRIAASRNAQHDHGKGSDERRSDAVFIGDKFNRHNTAPGCERAVNFAQKLFIRTWIEMVKKAGEQD